MPRDIFYFLFITSNQKILIIMYDKYIIILLDYIVYIFILFITKYFITRIYKSTHYPLIAEHK